MALTPSSMPILGMLTWRPMAGYEIRQEIQGSIGNFWSESFGQIYPQLRILSEAGLIKILPGEQSTGQSKKTYEITDTGRQALRDWIARDPVNRPPRDELLLKVFFAPEGDRQRVRDHIKKARDEAVARLRTFQVIETQLQKLTAHQDKSRFWRMTLKLGISDAQTFIAWCDEALAEFRDENTNENTDEETEK